MTTSFLIHQFAINLRYCWDHDKGRDINLGIVFLELHCFQNKSRCLVGKIINSGSESGKQNRLHPPFGYIGEIINSGSESGKQNRLHPPFGSRSALVFLPWFFEQVCSWLLRPRCMNEFCRKPWRMRVTVVQSQLAAVSYSSVSYSSYSCPIRVLFVYLLKVRTNVFRTNEPNWHAFLIIRFNTASSNNIATSTNSYLIWEQW